MTAIVFETPGLIDIRAFTTMGVSVKPSTDHPIGKFGTGLKYAIAVLARMGAETKVWIGRDQYEFFKMRTAFRDQNVDVVMMRAKKWPQRMFRMYELPFTTEYGKFWKPWMVYRELEANTRDEGGQTYEAAESWVGTSPWKDKSLIVVDHQEFFDAWEKRDEVFLPGASAKIRGDEILEVFPGPSKFLYWRGMKVYELPKPSLFTYNVLRDMELTEDRTLKYEFYARMALGDYTQKSENADFVRQIVTATKDDWESSVDFTSWLRPLPGPTFMSVVRSKPSGTLEQALARFSEVTLPTIEKTEDLKKGHPRPWKVVSDWVEDAVGRNVFQKPSDYRGDWSIVAEAVTELMNRKDDEDASEDSSRSGGEGLSGVRDQEGGDALRLEPLPGPDSAETDASVPF